MKREITALLTILTLSSLLVAQATVTLTPKTPASTEKVVVIMFDDGWLSQYTTALPILESYGYKASFAIYPKAIDGQYKDYMSWTQIEALAENGHDIESHTYSHLDLTSMRSFVLSSELVNSKLELEQHLIQSGALIYPEGLGIDNQTVKQAVKDAGYLIARGVEDGTVNLEDPNLDYYALNCNVIGISTTLPYFESCFYDVSGSNIAILLYHKIDNIDTNEETVTVNNFEQQMQFLHDNNFTVRTLSDVFFDITPLTAPLPTPTPVPTPTATHSTTPLPTPSPSHMDPPTQTPTPIPTATKPPTVTASNVPLETPTAQPTTRAPVDFMSDFTALLIILVCVLVVVLTFTLLLKRQS